MFTNRVRKWIVVLVGVLALALLTWAGTALAAQSHHGPATSSTASTQAVQVLSQRGVAQKLVGVVQSVDPTKQTFTLLPTGQAKTVTIAYDAHTDMHNDHRALQLTAGMHVIAHVVTHSDGSLYTTEIEPVAVHGSSTTRIHIAPAMEQVHTVLMICTTSIDAKGSALRDGAPASG